MEQSFHNMSLFFLKLHVWVIYVPNLAFTFHHIFLNDRYVILQTKRYSNWFWGFMSENILCSQKKLKSSQYTTCPHFIAFPWKAQHFGIAFFRLLLLNNFSGTLELARISTVWKSRESTKNHEARLQWS